MNRKLSAGIDAGVPECAREGLSPSNGVSTTRKPAQSDLPCRWRDHDVNDVAGRLLYGLQHEDA
jgi:hypothetical protein